MEIALQIDSKNEKFLKCIYYKIYPPFSQNIGKLSMRKVRMDTGSNCAVSYIGKNGNYWYDADNNNVWKEGFKHNFMLMFYRKVDISKLGDVSETEAFLDAGRPFPLKSYLKDEDNRYMYGLLLPHDDIDTANGRTDVTFPETQTTNHGHIRGLYNKEPDFTIGSHAHVVPKLNTNEKVEQYILFRERKLGLFYFSLDTKEYTFKSDYSTVPDLLFRTDEEINKTIFFRIRFLDLGRTIFKGIIRLYVPLEWDE